MSDTVTGASFNFDNSYAEQLEGFYQPLNGDKAPAPKLIALNDELAQELQIDFKNSSNAEIAEMLSGGVPPDGATPLAQVYAGHQFGHFNPQLGDGRALLLGEVIDINGNRFDIQLKGAGRTPYSRGGDGKAALAPVLREYIIGEAMHALNIPTTRALAAVTTGENVMREEPLPGAVLTRVAASHLRVGTFQFFAARNEYESVKQLADYAIKRHYPELLSSENKYLEFLKAVGKRQANLIVKWMGVGFVHGVMNTDNMTISGETIDYGPCAFIDKYNPATVFSSIDQRGRYAYANQPPIGQWNMARLAETLLPLIDADSEKAIELATKVVESFSDDYQNLWMDSMRAKLGLSQKESSDRELFTSLLKLLETQNVDFTLFFRALSEYLVDDKEKVLKLFAAPEAIEPWLEKWSERLVLEPMDNTECADLMNTVNPVYIPRNHKVEEALQAAERNGNYEPFKQLMAVLADPFNPQDGKEEFAGPPSEGLAPYKTFCGT